MKTDQLFRVRAVIYASELDLPAMDRLTDMFPGGVIEFTTAPVTDLGAAYTQASQIVDDLTSAYPDDNLIVTYMQLNQLFKKAFADFDDSEFMSDATLKTGEFPPIQDKSHIMHLWINTAKRAHLDLETMMSDSPAVEAMAGRITLEIFDSAEKTHTVH